MKRSQTKMEKEKNRYGGANRTFPALGAGEMVIRKIASCSFLVKYVSYMISVKYAVWLQCRVTKLFRRIHTETQEKHICNISPDFERNPPLIWRQMENEENQLKICFIVYVKYCTLKVRDKGTFQKILYVFWFKTSKAYISLNFSSIPKGHIILMNVNSSLNLSCPCHNSETIPWKIDVWGLWWS